VGGYSSMLLDYSRKSGLDSAIHIFEPSRKCFDILARKFGSLHHIALSRYALSDGEGNFEIYYDEEKSALASLHKTNLKHYQIEMTKSEMVKTIQAATYIEAKKIEHIDLIKIDIEGHELKALQGFGKYMRGEFIDFIQFEYAGANLDSHTSLTEIYDFLEGKGFTLAKVMRKGLEIRKYQPFMENFNYANYVAISDKVMSSLR
jgi:FkbM family methyltransferase